MKKHILQQYSDLLARVKFVRKSIDDLNRKISQISTGEYCVTDSVTKGKRGKKPLGTVVITGVPYPEYNRKKNLLKKRERRLKIEEQELLELTSQVEEYIAGIEDVEIRNILSLYYIDDLNWVQVAHRMNGIYEGKRKYTDSSCRRKHDRFLDKIEKI